MKARGPGLTLIGRLPLPVLGVRLIQVGEAWPQLQNAMERRQVQLTWQRKKTLDLTLGAGAKPPSWAHSSHKGRCAPPKASAHLPPLL